MSWPAFAAAAPDLAERVRERLTTHKHHTLATLRRDGSPRISGTECAFDDDGTLWIGSMWQARKAQDLLRDPRYALHSHSEDPPAWPGDAKVSGTVVASEFEHLGQRSHRFELLVAEASFARVEGDEMVITWWTPGVGVREVRRT